MGKNRTQKWIAGAIFFASTGLASFATAQIPSTAPAFEIKNVPHLKSAIPSTTSGAPSLIVRPSVNLAEHLNNCVVEMIQPDTSKEKVTLRIMVPDSVDVIEVIPNQRAGSTRNFRVKVDLNQPDSHLASSRKNASNPSALNTSGGTAIRSEQFKQNPFFRDGFDAPSRVAKKTLSRVTQTAATNPNHCLLYTSPSPRDRG